jgi:endonuclease YncB( thermonuclease family)
VRIDDVPPVFRSIVRRFSLALILIASTALFAGAAEARPGPCYKPAAAVSCDVITGKVTSVSDGDTFFVDLDRDGSKQHFSVRVTGINAMEQSVYSRVAARRVGECHALEATARLERLLKRARWRVRLSSLSPTARSGVRLRRSVSIKLKRRWIDVGQTLMREGHALWLPNRNENAWNADYARQGEYAASKLRGLWNPTYCGVGPSDASPLQVVVNADQRYSGGEWVRIRNLDPVNTVPLGGWWLRDSSLQRYTFPAWVTLPPGETLTVYVGEGVDTFTELFWNLQKTVFDNAGGTAMGDGAYLFDPQGDLRASMTYPCVRACADPYAGVVKVTAKPTGREYVTVQNVAPYAIDLNGYRLESPPYGYAFPRGSVLQPGESMRVWVTGDPAEDTALEKYWGETGAILNNGGDKVRISSFRGIVLDCYTYGTGSC